MNIVVATIHPWNKKLYLELHKRDKGNNWHLFYGKSSLTLDNLRRINPRYIFFPHWSWIIPSAIWQNYECVVFHMTDLPYGRGGTPLQNLIIRGHKTTQISALKVDGGLDTGPIYIKENLSLEGSAALIYKRASNLVFEKMIPAIIQKNSIPKAQTGKVTTFIRRKPAASLIDQNSSISQIFDNIRMLDAPGYPKAYLDIGKFHMEFTKAKLDGKKLSAKVSIYEK